MHYNLLTHTSQLSLPTYWAVCQAIIMLYPACPGSHSRGLAYSKIIAGQLSYRSGSGLEVVEVKEQHRPCSGHHQSPSESMKTVAQYLQHLFTILQTKIIMKFIIVCASDCNYYYISSSMLFRSFGPMFTVHHGGATQDEGLTPFGCCNQTKCDHLQVVSQQR